jgi:hypothetical protein
MTIATVTQQLALLWIGPLLHPHRCPPVVVVLCLVMAAAVAAVAVDMLTWRQWHRQVAHSIGSARVQL